MPANLPAGVYEDLVTTALDDAINARRADNWHVSVREGDAAQRAEMLARHIYTLAKRAFADSSGGADEQLSRQVELANLLVQHLQQAGSLPGDEIASAAQLLLEAQPPAALAEHRDAVRPTLSLRRSGLLVGGGRGAQIATEVAREIPTADRIDLLCAFVRHSGLRLFSTELKSRLDAGASMRVIASVYTGSTERKALDALVDMGAQVKVSYDTSRTRLHAKAWLFHRNSGLHTAYIGSSNLTHSAQTEGLEWNVRASAADNPDVVDRFEETFEQYWNEVEFEDYQPGRDGEKLARALQGSGGDSALDLPLALLVDVAPKPHQATVLEALAAERAQGHWRNLVVAATGTGKTWMAAFDFKRLHAEHGMRSLLFVAHRDEILRQSQQVYQLVMREPAFGERLVAGEVPARGQVVFASVHSLNARIDAIDAHAYEVVVVDEFHHASAPTYKRLLEHLKPKVLLGLTATPERADGASVLHYFDHRIASETRLWEALDLGLLCPFHYFGVSDATSLADVQFAGNRYVQGALDNLLTGDDARAHRIIAAVVEYVSEPARMRALGFCAGVAHAHFMADKFSAAGLSAVAVDGTTPNDERSAAIRRLRAGKLQAVFTVDLFNEGVDIPEVDTLLLLRPTESATVFLQQLGRGLRWADTKRVLTVLDFIGQSHQRYRYDVRYRALTGGTRHQLRRQVEAGFPRLPPGCAIRLEAQARDHVLENLQAALHNFRAFLLGELRAMPRDTRMPAFVDQSGIDLTELYAKPSQGHCFTQLVRQRDVALGLVADGVSVADPQLRGIGRLLHADDVPRLSTWRRLLRRAGAPVDEREQRTAMMLFAQLAGARADVAGVDALFGQIRADATFAAELDDLLALLADRSRVLCKPLDPDGELPLSSHAHYSLIEVVAAYGRVSRNNTIVPPQAGVLHDEASRTDLLFITLEKSEADYSPETRYADYPLSPKRFHWESQNNTRADGKVGQRYQHHARDGGKVMLFVRRSREDDRGETMAYCCLGYARYVSHESERPMKIVWELEREIPGELLA